MVRNYHSNKIKYLGVYVDETLSGNEHCEELTKKTKSCQWYYALISLLKNGSQVWGQSSATVVKKDISLAEKKQYEL